MNAIKALIKQYKQIALPVKASFWFILCYVIHKSMYFIMVPIFTRIMTTEQYGVYSVFNSWVLLISAFAGLNLAGNSFNVGMIKNESRKDEYTSSILGLWWVNTTIVFVIMLLFKNIWLKYSGLNLLFLIAVFADIYATASVDLWTARQKFDYKYKALLLITFSIALFTAVISIIFVHLLEKKDLAAIWCKVGVLGLHSVIISIILISKGKTIFNKNFWKAAYRFNIPLIAYYLSLTILNQSDRIMINSFFGASQAGIYSIAYSFAMIFTVLNSAINGAFVPWEFRNIKSNNYKSIAKISNIILILIGAANLILIALAPEIIHLFTVKEYYEAIWVIPPVALSAYLTCVYQLFVNIEFYYEKNNFVMVASIMVALLNIVLNLIFIPKFGYMAAAYTTLVSYLCFSVAHYVFMRSIIKKNGKSQAIYNIGVILFISLIITFAAFMFMLLYQTLIVRYALLLIMCSLFFIVLMRNKDLIIKTNNK